MPFSPKSASNRHHLYWAFIPYGSLEKNDVSVYHAHNFDVSLFVIRSKISCIAEALMTCTLITATIFATSSELLCWRIYEAILQRTHAHHSQSSNFIYSASYLSYVNVRAECISLHVMVNTIFHVCTLWYVWLVRYECFGAGCQWQWLKWAKSRRNNSFHSFGKFALRSACANIYCTHRSIQTHTRAYMRLHYTYTI